MIVGVGDGSDILSDIMDMMRGVGMGSVKGEGVRVGMYQAICCIGSAQLLLARKRPRIHYTREFDLLQATSKC